MEQISEVKYKEVQKVDTPVDQNKKADQNTDQIEDSSFMKFLRRHWATIAVIIYIISPIDILPDFIPIAGSVDDALLLAFQLFQEYRAYRARNPKS